MPDPCNIWIAMSLPAAKYSNDEKSGQTVGKLFLRETSSFNARSVGFNKNELWFSFLRFYHD